MSTKIENEEASKGSLKVEKKKPGRPRKMVNNPEITKVEIKKQVDAIPEQSTTIVDENKQTETLEKVEERTSESKPEESTKEKEEVIIEEKIVEEAEELTVQANEAIRDEKVDGIQLPET